MNGLVERVRRAQDLAKSGSLSPKITDELLSEVASYIEAKESDDPVARSVRNLSYSETSAMKVLLTEVPSSGGIVVASSIADRAGLTRSVIVNALRKLESAGVITARSSGMKGTHIAFTAADYRNRLLEAIG